MTDTPTGRSGGLLARTRPEHRPKVFYTNTGYEYWGRAAALIHTSPDGRRDVPPLPSERIYHLAGGQHFVGSFPPPDGARVGDGAAFRGNPLDFLYTLRALAVRLVAWVADGAEPPPSAYPTLAGGSLVPVGALAFPPLTGVAAPRVAHVAYRADSGPRFATEGIVDLQPPSLGPPFPALVPQVDGLGNEVAGVRSVELRVPVATYAPWNLRRGLPGDERELTDFVGTWIPLPRDDAERAEWGDPRPSLEALYPDAVAYGERLRQAAEDLTAAGYLLAEDVPRVLARGRALWSWLSEWEGIMPATGRTGPAARRDTPPSPR